jgi:hypothetical protein
MMFVNPACEIFPSFAFKFSPASTRKAGSTTSPSQSCVAPPEATSRLTSPMPATCTLQKLSAEDVAQSFADDMPTVMLRNVPLRCGREELLAKFSSFEAYSSRKILEVAPADTQGFEANSKKYTKQKITNSWFRPWSKSWGI